MAYKGYFLVPLEPLALQKRMYLVLSSPKWEISAHNYEPDSAIDWGRSFRIRRKISALMLQKKESFNASEKTLPIQPKNFLFER